MRPSDIDAYEAHITTATASRSLHVFSCKLREEEHVFEFAYFSCRFVSSLKEFNNPQSVLFDVVVDSLGLSLSFLFLLLSGLYLLTFLMIDAFLWRGAASDGFTNRPEFSWFCFLYWLAACGR
jgi:hypothetical protein